MYRIRKLEVRKFRGVGDPVTLEFGDRYHLIVGDNGAGKTNLLKLLAMVTRLDFLPLEKESFDISWEGESDEGWRIRGTFKREVLLGPLNNSGEVSLKLTWNYELNLEIKVGDPVRVADHGTADVGSKEDPIVLHSRLYPALRVGMPTEFLWDAKSARSDEALGAFSALIGDSSKVHENCDVSAFKIDVLIPPGGERPFTAWVWRLDDWPKVVGAGGSRLLRSKDLPWIGKVETDFNAQEIILAPKYVGRGRFADRFERLSFSGADVYTTFSPDLEVNHDRLSFGQKRLLALRYYLSTIPKAPAIIDELSNGLHHAWVESIIRDLEPHQSFLATQNPLVMDKVWWDTPEEAQKGIILCTRTPDHKWQWRQLSMEEARLFYDAWTVGVQQIHEVLKTEGWW